MTEQVLSSVSPEVLMLGAAICDIPVCPVSPEVFISGSHPVERIVLQSGGDAFNEAVILSRLGHPVRLVSVVGRDVPGDYVLKVCDEEGIDSSFIHRREEMDTGINIVLVSENGERSFLTSRTGSLRALALDDLLPAVESLAEQPSVRCVTFASIFVYPRISCGDLDRLFKEVKAQGRLLCADMTKCKNHETLKDIQEALSYVDYLFPNYEEASLLCGRTDPDEIADAFLDCGVGTLVMKLGADGCLLKSRNLSVRIPACPGSVCLDTTGAGDNFAAAFTAALLEGHAPEECARYASAASSLCIAREGAVTGVKSAAQVKRRMEEGYRI